MDVVQAGSERGHVRGENVDVRMMEAPNSVVAIFLDGHNQADGPLNEDSIGVAFTCLEPGVEQKVTVYNKEENSKSKWCGIEYFITCTETQTPTETITETVTETATEPTSIPPGDTDCVVDSDGCLVEDGSGYGCNIVLDEPLESDSATLTVTGTVEDGIGISLIEAMLYASFDPYYGTYGPGCKVSYDDAVIVDNGYSLLDSVVFPEASKPRNFTITCRVDRATGTIWMEGSVTNADPIALEASGLSPTSEDQIVLGVRGSRICGASLTQ